MTSREIIRRVITFAGAARVGFHLPDPWPNDFASGGIDPAPGFDEQRRTAIGLAVNSLSPGGRGNRSARAATRGVGRYGIDRPRRGR
jgi:hypothetical protein